MREEGDFFFWICNFKQKSDGFRNELEVTFNHHFYVKISNFRYRFNFDRANDLWITPILCVKIFCEIEGVQKDSGSIVSGELCWVM